MSNLISSSRASAISSLFVTLVIFGLFQSYYCASTAASAENRHVKEDSLLEDKFLLGNDMENAKLREVDDEELIEQRLEELLELIKIHYRLQGGAKSHNKHLLPVSSFDLEPSLETVKRDNIKRPFNPQTSKSSQPEFKSKLILYAISGWGKRNSRFNPQTR